MSYSYYLKTIIYYENACDYWVILQSLYFYVVEYYAQ